MATCHKKIPIGRSCRQGDPVAPYLFLIISEILAILVKNNKDIKGININGIEHKISQYADDTSFILDGSEESFNAAFDTLKTFEVLWTENKLR